MGAVPGNNKLIVQAKTELAEIKASTTLNKTEKASQIIKVESDELSNKIDNAESIKFDDGLKFWGELLFELRSQKEMTLLMLCRQLLKIDVKSGVAELFFDDSTLELVMQNDKFSANVGKFFSDKGLKLIVHQNEKKISDADKLNKLLSGKLKIINI